MKAHRYTFYVAFALGALLFWLIIVVFVLGDMPGDPACAFQPGGCPPPPLWRHLLDLAVIFGAIPTTVLLFIYYRRWVRRKLGIEEDY